MNRPSASTSRSEGRILVLETDDALNTAILTALHEASPAATIDIAHSVTEAQRMVLEARPDLFVLDMDATEELSQDFLIDLRTSHPDARAIILTAVHLPAHREHAAGIGAIHFLEKPFPHAEFVDLVHALLRPGDTPRQERFQGTLSDLHLSDIIQLKCMSGTTSVLEFTGPRSEKARIYFENGQVRHAVAPGREGVDAFNEIVGWKGGKISEGHAAGAVPRTINIDWQFLLMEAVRQIDETSAQRERRRQTSHRHKILVIDDSPMLLSFVQEILAEANYDVVTAANATEGLQAAHEQNPDLVLLDYVLPDFRGDEVSRRLEADPTTAHLPILYMSGFGADLENARSSNIVGIVNKPFTSEHLIATVEEHLPGAVSDLPVREKRSANENAAASYQFSDVIGPETEPIVASEPAMLLPTESALSEKSSYPNGGIALPETQAASARDIFFAGETSFFSLSRALRTIEKESLRGVFRCTCDGKTIELYARDGKVIVVTTRDADLYCAKLPAEFASMPTEQIARAREKQTQTGRPIYQTLAEQTLLAPEKADQLQRQHGRTLFAPLWTARVRFVFEILPSLPSFVPAFTEDGNIDQWALTILRLLPETSVPQEFHGDDTWIPAHTRTGRERIRNLQLTVAEENFIAEINGVRSLARIVKEMGHDLTTARLHLFRFVALETIECWPPAAPSKPERRGLLKRQARSAGVIR
ncbi:MAG: response regulator [Verrucomicrobiota bacterium]